MNRSRCPSRLPWVLHLTLDEHRAFLDLRELILESGWGHGLCFSPPPPEYHRIRCLTVEVSLHQLDTYPARLPAVAVFKKSDETRHAPIPG